MPRFLISDGAADFIVRQASDEAKRLERLARGKNYGGRENEGLRKQFRARARDLRCAIAGLNTGDGVTRRSARDA